jgi:GNAT superfamily N-acetyltransferase
MPTCCPPGKTPVVDVRRPSLAELEACAGIERRAGELFRAVGLDQVADDEPFPVDELAAGDVWVAVEDGVVAGYVYSLVLDGTRHVEQVTVDPAFARRGVGARLLDHLGDPLTLTTFRDVPWNGPYYERLGFRTTTDLGPELAARVEHERWLERLAPRVVMRRP